MNVAKSISERGTHTCRGCEGQDLLEVLNLGTQPLPSEYGETADEILEEFPLVLRVCNKCGLGQLGEFVLPERIFHPKYPYLSSASTTWLEHSDTYATGMISELKLSENSLVVELASNDGYLLSIFKRAGISVLGVEPAKNVAQMALAQGVPTVVEFFSAETGKRIAEEYGKPDLIVANNVFAHVPDMRDFMEGIAILCGEETLVTIENPSFSTLMRRGYFDTIYHEHYSYLTAHSVQKVAKDFGLELVDVQELSTHGGSNRYLLRKRGRALQHQSVQLVIQSELDAGLLDQLFWASFAEKVRASLESMRSWLAERETEGAVVVAYGAAHKGNTFLNSVGTLSQKIRYVVDASVEKQGKFLPGSRIPVLPPEALGEAEPTDVLILPWNIASEISLRIRGLVPEARIWIAQPKLEQLE